MTEVYSSHAVADRGTRQTRARKIVNVLSRHVALDRCEVLDIGTGSGHIAAGLAEAARSVTSVNIDDERTEREGYRFVLVEDHRLPFPDGSFDVVVTNHVIEHMPHQRDHLAEIARVLRDDGVAYLATPNRLAVIEPHFKLAFLSWLPHSLADRYLRMRRAEAWDVYPLGSGRLHRLAGERFSVEDVTVDMLRHPAAYELDIGHALHGLLGRVPRWLYRVAYPLIPSYILLLRPATRGWHE